MKRLIVVEWDEGAGATDAEAGEYLQVAGDSIMAWLIDAGYENVVITMEPGEGTNR